MNQISSRSIKECLKANKAAQCLVNILQRNAYEKDHVFDLQRK